ncbi:MAG: alanine racemase [Actinomycetia bacterium]|nr:alanine racemase [Actinomycetes bacterium]
MTSYRPVWAEVDLDAIRANVRMLRETVAPAQVLAVVKADGYGHGAVPVGRAALEAGAAALGVALVEEGVTLRDAGIDAPILVLSEPVPDAAPYVVAHRLTPVVYTPRGIEALAKAVAESGRDQPLPVHLKVDTGMHRVGAATRDAAVLARQIADRAELRLEGVCTHFAVADEPDNPYTNDQLASFDGVLATLHGLGIEPDIVHTANTAAAIAFPSSRRDMVRAGIGIYGVAPGPALANALALRPALAVKAHVSHVKPLSAGSRVSYGLRYTLANDSNIATVPVGYGDGVPRNLAAGGGEVLVHGRRCRIAGTVTMDQLMVDVGSLPVVGGDEVVLLGRQGDEQITAAEWAERLGTIAYEIVCGIGPRVPREYVGTTS